MEGGGGVGVDGQKARARGCEERRRRQSLASPTVTEEVGGGDSSTGGRGSGARDSGSGGGTCRRGFSFLFFLSCGEGWVSVLIFFLSCGDAAGMAHRPMVVVQRGVGIEEVEPSNEVEPSPRSIPSRDHHYKQKI